MIYILIFFSQVIFCVFKTLIIYTTMKGERVKTSGIAVTLGALNLALTFYGIKAIEAGDATLVLVYLSGNFVGTYFSTNPKYRNNDSE